MPTYVVHYAEIGLKGRNRSDFELCLAENIRTQHPAVQKVRRLRGRMVVEAEAGIDLRGVFGIAWWAEVDQVPSDLGAIREAVLRAVPQATTDGVRTFAIRVVQGDRVLAMTSQEVETELGAAVQAEIPLEVDLSAPDLTIFVEILRRNTYIYTEKFGGPRGLPVGASGKMMGLFSAGIDSAVATYLMAKRGARIELVHFYALPNGKIAHERKVGGLARRLLAYLPQLTIHYLPYHAFQLATADLPVQLRRQELVVFRRFMARAAARLAVEHGALGLFSGDNLGQVASQTLENLAAVDAAIQMPLFRPLISYDKQEIIDLGEQLGIFEIAKRPYKDCCSIIARHPATVAKPDRIEAIESMIGLEELLASVLAERESVRLESAAPLVERWLDPEDLRETAVH